MPRTDFTIKLRFFIPWGTQRIIVIRGLDQNGGILFEEAGGISTIVGGEVSLRPNFSLIDRKKDRCDDCVYTISFFRIPPPFWPP